MPKLLVTYGSCEASKHDHGKKTTTKVPPTPQHGNKTTGNSRYLDSVVSRFMSKSGLMHWMAVMQIMRYLKGM